MLVVLHWSILLLFVLFFLIFYFLSTRLTHKAVEQSHQVNLEKEIYQGFAFESINNISTVKSLGISQKIIDALDRISLRLIKTINRRITYYQTRNIILSLYMETLKLVVIIYTIYGIMQGKIAIGIIAVVVLYSGKLDDVFNSFAELYHNFVSFKVDALRMLELQDVVPKVELTGEEKFSRKWKKISLQDVSFSYTSKKVINNLSLDINRGEKIGIVGISGAGKSTLFKLLLKLYVDYSGEILFDGKSLKDIRRKFYVDSIAVVLQDVELFNISLGDNITFSGRGSINKPLLRRALKVAHVNDFLKKLPKGLDTIIGEKGVKLSGGERQRVAIARAIYSQPDLLLLDEATSHLDVHSEKKIQSALRNFLNEVTAIVIAHRLSTIKEMDRIIVMHEGRIVEMGKFDELIEQKGKFYEMWRQME